MIMHDFVTASDRLEQFHSNEKKLENASKQPTMLILPRHSGQSVWINNEIQIIVLGHFKDIAHIGIEAPPDTKITRGELKDNEVETEHD